MTAAPTRAPRAGMLLAAAACLLAVWSLVPFATWWDGVSPSYFSGTWQTWITGSVLVALITVTVLVFSKGRIPAALPRCWDAIMSVPSPLFLFIICVILAALTVFFTLVVFDGNPRNVDGFAQLFQARIFLAGRLWNAPPVPLANFATLQMILGPTKWLSQYPPGQSLVLATSLLLGKWWLLNPLMIVVFALATYRVARWCADEATARLTLILLCVAPFVLAVAGSEMSHLAAATLGMSAAAVAITATRRPAWALACGLLLGLMTSFRPLDAVAATVPAGLILLAAPRRGRTIAAAIIGGVAGAVPILWFNTISNGSPTTFGYNALWGPQHSLGFHPVPWGEPLTPLRAIARSGMDLHQLNAYLLDATLPALLVVALGFLAGRKQAGWRDALPFAGAGALIGLLFFYWHRDVFYGPRFLYSAVAWFVIVLARALVMLRRSWPAPDGRGHGLTAAFVVIVSIAFGVLFNAPDRIRIYRQTTPIFSLHPDRDAARSGLHHALVLVPDGWGSRLIARMWELGIPVRRSSRIYAAIDACTLEGLLSTAERDSSAHRSLAAVLDSLTAVHHGGTRAGVTDDPNLRLLPGVPLAPACEQEIAVDRRGYYSYAPWLWLNTADLDGDIVWARDLGPRNTPLLARYAGRRVVRYVPGPDRQPAFMPVSGPGW
jgi:hypothetical protein